MADAPVVEYSDTAFYSRANTHPTASSQCGIDPSSELAVKTTSLCMGKQSEAVPFGEVKSPSIPSATRSSVRLQRTTISCRPIAHQDMIDSECVTNCRRHFGPHEHAPAALVRHPPGRLPARTSALHIMASTPATSASVVSPRAARRRDPRARMFGLVRRIPPILLVALALARCPTAVAGETLRARG